MKDSFCLLNRASYSSILASDSSRDGCFPAVIAPLLAELRVGGGVVAARERF